MKGIMDYLKGMVVGDVIFVKDIERPNVYKLATKARRKVKVRRIDNGFRVECKEILLSPLTKYAKQVA